MTDRFRNVIFTLNNYTLDEIEHIKNGNFKYIVFQEERGEQNGTPHLQGYAVNREGLSRPQWATKLGPRAWFKRANGSAAENRIYCTKDRARIPGTLIYEAGDIPTPGRRTDLNDIAAQVVAGATLAELAQDRPAAIVQYANGLQRLRTLSLRPRNFKTLVFWLHGPTGTGKTAKAFERFPDAYWKMGGNKWWDGYDAHQTVIIDDYRKDLCPFHELLRLLDRYPHQVECKGGTVQFVSRHIVITSPYPPAGIWEGRCEEDLGQLLRRIEHIEFFGRNDTRVVSKSTDESIALLRDPVVPDGDGPRLTLDDPGADQGAIDQDPGDATFSYPTQEEIGEGNHTIDLTSEAHETTQIGVSPSFGFVSSPRSSPLSMGSRRRWYLPEGLLTLEDPIPVIDLTQEPSPLRPKKNRRRIIVDEVDDE